jgi:hypothetical protein
MFVRAPLQIAGDADVEDAVSAIGYDIDKSAHPSNLSKAWMAGTSPAMTNLKARKVARHPQFVTTTRASTSV